MLAALTAPIAQARTRHPDAWAREHFATAERMREALNGRPPGERTRHDYQKVVNAYRAVYLGSPASSKADPSVVAVAETLVEMGRRFDDDSILNKAIEQYKFLRREYPGSKYRFDGLFTIGEVYKDDLNNPALARSTFEDFLRRYPHNRLADDAREAIAEIDQEAKAEKIAGKNTGKKADEARAAAKADTKGDSAGPVPDAHADVGAKNSELPESGSQGRSGRLPRVTGIRHWSTPDYTRVAIDVESDVKFTSQRIGTPARIYFDLKETKLASTLVGKSFDVDDGFLKKVRVAQFAPGRTRVVLEVDDLSDYEAFLLPNPYRLIVDLHGKNLAGKPGGTRSPKKDAESAVDSSSAEHLPSDSGSASPAAEAKPVDLVSAPDASKLAEPNSESKPDGSKPDGSKSGESKSAESKTLPVTIVGPQKADASRVKKVVVEAEDENNDDTPIPPAASAKDDGGRLRPSHGGRKILPAVSDQPPVVVMREARPTASGDRSLIRALGLKIGRIVIDPGHGGHDSGTIGPNGLEEKDLVLEVGRRLGKLLETRLGAEVVYTRKDDTFIPLETRTAIANQARADLFVSIHANSSHDPGARGVETYYLNFTSSPEALEVAARENAVSEKSIFELQDLVKKIALKEKIEESREFAGDVQQSLHSGLAVKSPAIRDRGVKKAPFIVLIGANMPSILAEISFVSNPADERRLATSDYRERIAESLYRGIAKYANGLSGVKVASKMDKEAGQ